MTTPVGGKTGKCSNFGNCQLADTRAAQQIPGGVDFVCGECGKPLLLTDAGQPAGNRSTMMIVVGVMVALLLAAAGFAWNSMRGDKQPATPIAAPPPPSQPPSPAVAAPPPPPAAPSPSQAAPETGNCSDADAKVGICRKKP